MPGEGQNNERNTNKTADREAYAVFNRKDIVKRCRKLFESNHFTDTRYKELSASLMETSKALYDYADGKEADVSAALTSVDSYIPKMGALKNRTADATPGTPEYAEMMELFALTSAMTDALDVCKAASGGAADIDTVFKANRTRLKQNILDDVEKNSNLAISSTGKVLFGADDGDEEEFFGVHETGGPTLYEQTLIDLGDYTSSYQRPDKKDIEDLDRLIKTVDDQLPKEALSLFDDASTLSDINNKIKAAQDTGIKIALEKICLYDDFMAGIKQFCKENKFAIKPDSEYSLDFFTHLPELAEKSEEEGRDLIRSHFDPNCIDKPTDHITKSLAVDQLHKYCLANAPIVKEIRDELAKVAPVTDNESLIIKKAALEYKKSYLAAGLTAESKAPNALSEDNKRTLSWLSQQLERVPKSGENSTLYDTFAEAVQSAANGGSLSRLVESAQNYVNTRKGVLFGPRTAVGKHRLQIAQQVLNMAKMSDQVDKHAIGTADLPKAEKKAEKPSKSAEAQPQPEPEKKRVIVNSFQSVRSTGSSHYTGHIGKYSTEHKQAFDVVDALNDPNVRVMTDEEIAASKKGFLPLSKIQVMRSHDEFMMTELIDWAHLATHKGYDDCKKIAGMIVDIAERNLTGDKRFDLKNAFLQYEKELLLPNPETGEPPLIPGYEKGTINHYIFNPFASVQNLINVYALGVAEEYPEEAAMAKNGNGNRERLIQKQLDKVVDKYQKLEQNGTLSAQSTQTIIDSARKPSTTFRQRQFLLTLNTDDLKRLEGNTKNAEEFGEKINAAMGQVEKDTKDYVNNAWSKREKDINAEAEEYARKNSQVRQGP